MQCFSRNEKSKFFLISKFTYLLFSHPAHKSKTGTANNSKPPSPIIMIGQSVTKSSSQIIFIMLFLGKFYALLCILPASANCTKMLGQYHFAEPNRSMFWLVFIQLRAGAWVPRHPKKHRMAKRSASPSPRHNCINLCYKNLLDLEY